MKKHISILLVLCMLFTMLPMGMTVVSATTTTVEQSVADPATETEDVIEISTLQSEITLTFTPEVADASAVTFTTADGTAIKGAVVGTAGTVEGGSTYTLKFGRLEKDVEYKLTVPTSVTGNGAATVYTYKASIDGTKVDVNTEFTGEGFTLDAAPTDTRTSTAKTGLRYHYGDQRYDFSASANYNSAQNMKVIADGTDDQALELAPLKVTAEDEAVTYYGAELSVNASAQFKNIAAGDRDVYVIDTAVKAYADGEDAEVATPERRVFMPTRTDFSHGGGLGVFEVGNILKLQKLATSANNGVEIGAGESWKKVRAVIRDNGTLGYYNTTPVKPKTIDGATTDGTGLTPHQRVDLYDVTGAVPKYIDENATVTAEDYAYRIAQIVKPTSDDGLNSRMAVDYVYARKDKAMTVLKTDGYTKANKSVVFHMSDDIDAETVNTITVADANGEAVDGFIATVDAENRTITVSFPYGLGIAGTESSYTVDLGGVIGTNGVAVWNGKYVWNNEYTGTDKNGYVHQNLATQSITVATEEAGTLARVAESSIANGATDVSVHVGTASVTYEEALDDEILDGISIVSVDGETETAIRGKIIKTLSDDGKTVTLKFGRLGAGAHKIKVDGSVLKTAAGGEVATEAIEFTTTEPGYEINDDFSGESYVIGQPAPDSGYSSENKKGIRYFNGTTPSKDFAETGANVDVREEQTTVVADGSDGDKAIELRVLDTNTEGATTNTNYRQATMSIATSQFSTQLTDERDVYVIDSAIKRYLVDGTTTRGAAVDQYNFYPNAGKIMVASNAVANFSASNIKNLAATTIAADEDGWVKTRAVVRMGGLYGASTTTPVKPKANEGTGTAQLQITDLYNASASTPIYYGESSYYSLNSTVAVIGIIDGRYTGKHTSSVNDRVAIDYVRAKKDKAMTVLESDLGYAKDNRQVVFYMTDDIDAATIDTITVTDANGTAVEGVSVTADAATRAITVSFAEGLAAGTYTVDLSKVIGTNGVAVYNGVYTWDDATSAYIHEDLASIDFEISSAQAGSYASIASSTPAANAADVSVHVGEASVTYGFALKPDTLDGITLVSAVDGEEVALRGKVTKTLSDDGKTVTFKFGRLDAGLHRIKVDGAVLEAAGGEIVSTESIEFTTVDTEQTKLDFTTAEGFTAGSAIPDGKGILNALANGVSVVADGDTDNAVRVQPGEGTAGGYKAFNLIYDFSGGKLTGTAAKGAYLANGLEATTLTDVRDVYVVETALKASTPITHTNSDIRIMNGAYNASTTPPLTSTTESAVIAYTKYLLNGSDATIPAEADGWTKVRAVLRADGRYHGKYEAAWKDTAIKAPTESSIAPVVATDVYGASSAGAQFIGTAKGGTYNAVGINIAGFTLYDNNADFKQNYIDVDYIYTKKEKAMTVFDSDLGYTKADKKIVFYMTDDIDEASADRVVVKSGEKVIGDREVTVNNADRSITVKFAGLAAGSYTVDISKVLGTNGVAVYNGLYKWDTDAAAYSHENLATASFTVSETEGSFAVDSVTSGETAISDTIDADANEITITFAGTLADGAADAITFTKEGEDRIAGKLIKTQDGATVTLNFGRLEEGAKYILTIPDTVKNAGGAAVDAKTYTLTATREYEIKHDFSGMAEDGDTEIYNNDNGWKGSQSASSILAMSTGYNADLSTDEFGVVFDGIVTAKKNGEDTYLEMKPYSSTQTSSRTGAYLVPKKANGVATTFVGKYFNSEGTTYEGKDGYVLAMDARVNTQAIDPEATTMHLTSVFSIYDQPVAKFQGSGERGTLKSFYNGTGINLSPAYEFNAVAENEYNSARMVLSAKTRPAVYTEVEYKLYDLDNGTYVGKQANKTNYSYPIYSDIAVQTVSESWNPGSSNVAINLTDFAVFYAKAMSVLNTQLDTEDYVVTIAMTDEIDEATLGNLAITLDETAVNPATYDVGYNEEERTIEITFLYGLKTGVYNVSLAGVEPKNGLADGTAATSFEVEEGSAVYMANFAFEGSVDGGEFLELVSGEAGEGQISIGDADAIKVSAEIGGVDDPAVFLAVYDEDYNLVDVVKINYNADEDAYTATLDELPTNTVKHASMYVWRSLDTLVPLFKPLQCL